MENRFSPRESPGSAVRFISAGTSSIAFPGRIKGKLAKSSPVFSSSPDRCFALSRVNEVIKKYEDHYPKFSQRLEEGIEDTLACYYFPVSHQRRLRTTNMLERFNQEIKRRTRVVRIFPNEQACLRLILGPLYRAE